MAATTRQPKPPRKGGMPESNATRRPSAWTTARGSPTFSSPGMPNTRLPGGAQASGGSFPPLAGTNGAPRQDRPQDRILQQLSGLTGTTITLSTKTGQRYEGVIGSTGSEGDTSGVTLKDVKEISSPGQPLKDSLFIASTNIDTWSSGPADAKLTNGDTFKTDVDISKAGLVRERPLQAWADDIPDGSTASGTGGTGRYGDDVTFGLGASTGNNQWDQFAANEKLFGVKAGFDEEAYTTKLDRNAPDFKEKEKKAAQLANEIMLGATNNTHIAEERVMNFVGENGTNEEDRYGAVVRGANAYVPPGARKAAAAVGAGNGTPVTSSATPAVKPDVPKVSVNGPDGSTVKETQKPASPAPANAAKSTADPLPAFRSFVVNERDRLMKKKQAIMKHEMDKRMADLVKFSQTFKLNKPIPEDLVIILAKDEEKQQQIREKSTKDAESAQARAIGPSTLTTGSSPSINPSATSTRIGAPVAKVPTAGSPQPAAASSKAMIKTSSSSSSPQTKDAITSSKRISMVIQAIPPFKGKRTSTAPSGNTATSMANGSQPSVPPVRTSSTNTGSNSSAPLSPSAANRLNVNASSFRPTPKGAQGTGSGSGSPKTKPSDASPTPQGPLNPFFGTRSLKKTPPVHIKDDFNPFKHAKVMEATQIVPQWPYSGKRYISLFPLPAPPQQQQSPHMPHPGGPPPAMPPPPFEGESDPAAQAAQAAARGYLYTYPHYGYPSQPMMPGMPPPPGHMPYMQPIPYPYMPPPPNAMYPGTPMGQMPPPTAYMPPPPGSYPPPPNGAGPRPSMPPTPIPSHAHPYYHQSPQLQHAVPYPMMMPPPGAPGVPHPYEGTPAPPVQMGGVGHA